MSCLSEGESEENQRPELIASRSSIVRIGSSMGCRECCREIKSLVKSSTARQLSKLTPLSRQQGGKKLGVVAGVSLLFLRFVPNKIFTLIFLQDKTQKM
jgi:hypothetical protein